MRDTKNQARAGKASVLGIAVMICLLLFAAITLAVNLIFRDAATVPKMFGHRYYVYQYDDMESTDAGATIPAGAMVILDAEDVLAPTINQIVLYHSTTGDCRIGQVSLVLNETPEGSTAQQTMYYLTTAKNASAIAVPADDIIGVCRQRSTELGLVVRFLTSTAGLVVCMILPCVAILLYVAALFVAAREEAEDDDDDDTDLMFVKALQSKKKALDQKAATPAARAHDDRDAIAQEAAETEAAIRRAEKFAAIRKNIEGQRAASNTAEVPLYTTATRPAVSTTKQIAAPDPELLDLIAGRSTHDTETAQDDSTNALIAKLVADKAEQKTAVAKPTVTEKVPVAPAAEPVKESKPVAKPTPTVKSASTAKPAASKSTASKPAASKAASKSSAVDFGDLIAMLDAAQKHLDE
ncbi:MAG: hypothetical protein PUC41_00270 [Oscillospiraceae bacterium]|nr:hypothetical protein [Oscillospiraceae bacterium]